MNITERVEAWYKEQGLEDSSTAEKLDYFFNACQSLVRQNQDLIDKDPESQLRWFEIYVILAEN